MKKYLITTGIISILLTPLFVSADSSSSSTVSSTTIATPQTSPENKKACIILAKKNAVDAKAKAKAIYDNEKVLAMSVRLQSVASINSLPKSSIVEKKIGLKTVAETYKTSMLSSTKALEISRKKAQTSLIENLHTCEVALWKEKNTELEKKVDTRKGTNAIKKEEAKTKGVKEGGDKRAENTRKGGGKGQ